MSSVDDELAAISARIKEFSDWLEQDFNSHCAEDDYTDGCLSCDAGIAIKHLDRMRKALQPPTTKSTSKGR